MSYLYYLILFMGSWCLTWILRRYALATNMLDLPNHRSSHEFPTPRGGGLAFVFCFLLSVICLLSYKLIGTMLAVVLLGAGGIIALIGFIDDRISLPARWRLLGHFVVAVCVLYALGGMPVFSFKNGILISTVLANGVTVFYLVWMLNLYNFMDGIDGIAAIEALTVCLGGALLYYFSGHLNSAFLPISLAMVVAGFLFWNFPPARIFMGDVGSGFLGLVLGVLSIEAATVKTNFFWSWLILLGVFIVDATVTLLRRGMRGENIYEAHRSHAYQHASRYYGKHRFVTLGVLFINMLWLLPMALAVGFDLIDSRLGLMIAYLPLITLALKFKAGEKE